jgi:hypothetical protein
MFKKYVLLLLLASGGISAGSFVQADEITVQEQKIRKKTSITALKAVLFCLAVNGCCLIGEVIVDSIEPILPKFLPSHIKYMLLGGACISVIREVFPSDEQFETYENFLRKYIFKTGLPQEVL